MGMIKLRLGLEWGHLRVVEVGTDNKVTKDIEAGLTFEVKTRYAELVCDCGNKVRVWWDDWQGIKRFGYDCGCGLADLDKVKTPVYVHIPLGLKKQIKAKSDQMGCSFVRVMVRAIQDGLREWKGGYDAKS